MLSEKHLRARNILNLEVDVLQQKTTSGPSAVSQEQRTHALSNPNDKDQTNEVFNPEL